MTDELRNAAKKCAEFVCNNHPQHLKASAIAAWTVEFERILQPELESIHAEARQEIETSDQRGDEYKKAWEKAEQQLAEAQKELPAAYRCCPELNAKEAAEEYRKDRGVMRTEPATRTGIPATGATPPDVGDGVASQCWHKEIDENGICKACRAKAAIRIEGLPETKATERGSTVAVRAVSHETTSTQEAWDWWFSLGADERLQRIREMKREVSSACKEENERHNHG